MAIRTRMVWLLACSTLLLASCGVSGQKPVVDQTTLDRLAQTLKIEWAVVTNTREIERFDATMTLTNTDTQPMAYGDWTLYFYCIYPLEPDRMPRGQSLEVEGQGLEVRLVNGMLYTLAPTLNFTAIPPGGVRVLRFHMRFWSLARSDIFPNWYVTGSAGTSPRVVVSTAGIDAAFTAPRSSPQQQKRFDFDFYAARTAQQRYARNHVPYAAPEAEMRVVPTPWSLERVAGSDVTVRGWSVFDESDGKVLGQEAAYIVEKLTAAGQAVTVSPSPSLPASNVIVVGLSPIVIADKNVLDDLDDAYSLEVDDVNNVIKIKGVGASGVFGGAQTLLSLLRENGTVPKVLVYDAPRFSFRGLHLDLSRNFRSREEVERMLGVMARYKLNRLHLHLTDDEGWRIEIAGLPQLTEVGARRCHDPAEDQCLLPQLGSGPLTSTLTSGSGFLTAADYRSILTTAAKLHVQVIPEVDMPGHARAAIKAMEKRYRDLVATDPAAAAEFRLTDETDQSVYTTSQFFNDNAINVCMESSYAFVRKVVQEMKALHLGIQPLKEFHSGFDEVGPGAWLNSSICQRLVEADSFARQSLKQYFFKRVADIVHSEGLSLGGWEDGLMLTGNQPFNRSLAPNEEVFVNVWDNVWEWGTAARTHALANMDYKVVMSHATVLYFDHPHEPDEDERGLYWAARFTDAQKTFSFAPLSYYDNIHEQRSGQPLTREEICGKDDVNCPPLEKPQNIVGLQGQLFSEVVRTQDQADSQLFPRVLALAERAWHFADWEREPNATRRAQDQTADWFSFARAVGYRELPRLDEMGIRYRVPPPGAMVVRQKLMLAPGYPGLEVEYSRDNGATWTQADGTERVEESDRLLLRTKSADGQRYSRTVELMSTPEVTSTPQSVLDYIGEHVSVTFQVSDNYEKYGTRYYVITLTLNNTGTQPVPGSNWELHFPSVQWVEEEVVKEEREMVLPEHALALSHVNGYLFRLAPVPGFKPLEAGETRHVEFRGSYWSVSKFEQFPNYYVTAEGANARVIRNTAGESLSFVKDFSKVNQWKRDVTDKFDPLTPAARFGKQLDVADNGQAAQPYLPTPVTFRMDRSKTLSLSSDWVIVAPAGWADVADYLKDQLSTGLNVSLNGNNASTHYVELRMTSEGLPESQWPGAYNISVSPESETVVITARNSTGALYGVQSLLNMALQSQDNLTLFQMSAEDAPRFEFRGMYVDVSRNFHDKASILKTLRVMGLYKLNRLHLHLADDEGWRLQIPGLPELTTVGSQRCYDPTEERCLIPVLGSGPDPNNPGSGFYTIEDYKEILQAAAQRHIEVIPEFDMPGHSRAAIKAMALRRRILTEAGDIEGAHEFELDEEGDPSIYSSVQLFNDDAVNPCLESSYAFVRHVMREVKQMHAGVNPLTTYHFGGDEVAEGAWVHSKACAEHVRKGDDLKLLFSTRVAAVAAEEGLSLGAWEDGLMDLGVPIPRDEMGPRDVVANAWQNVWEWGAASRAHVLANEGYKVIMSQATHLYFDHPYEPDPEERGFYWATRTTDTRKTFLFQPQHLWSNVDMTRMGDPYTLSQVCGEEDKGCPALTQQGNVIGMQGHLWSETVRTEDQLDYMIFPRLLALAERAWHSAPWEGQEGRGKDKVEDWTRFANTLGYGQLAVLDKLNVSYRVCPPGVRQNFRELQMNTEFPGLKLQYMTSDSPSWKDVSNKRLDVKQGQRVDVRTLSADGQRSSRAVTMTISIDHVDTGPSGSCPRRGPVPATLLLCLLLLTAWRWARC